MDIIFFKFFPEIPIVSTLVIYPYRHVLVFLYDKGLEVESLYHTHMESV